MGFSTTIFTKLTLELSKYSSPVDAYALKNIDLINVEFVTHCYLSYILNECAEM